jgi:anti-sigma regulatory factor (Ser/Thr protein kinase)
LWSQAKRTDATSFLTLLPTKEPVPTIDFSIQYSDEGLGVAMQRIGDFLSEQGVDAQRSFAIKLSAEELIKNVVQYSHAASTTKAYIDIRLAVVATDKVSLSIRDDGRPFDPTTHRGKEGYGLKLATSFGQRLTYKYMFGQNITLVEI